MEKDSTGFSIVPNHLLGRIKGNEIAVYVALVSFADSTGECWPSHATIQKRAGISVSSIRRALDSLIEKDVVKCEPRRGPDGSITSNRYWVHVWSESK